MELTEEQKKERVQFFNTAINQISINENMTVRDLVDNFSGMSIQARNLGTAAKIWENMLFDDEKPTIFLGLAGPLIAAGLRNVICDLIKKNLVDVVVSTGAIIYQDYFYARGNKHYCGTPFVNDNDLGKLRVNRIYDVFSDDIAFEETDNFISEVSDGLEPKNYSSREFLIELSKTIDDKNSILQTCVEMNKPIFIPAMNDSSIGIGLMNHWARQKPGNRVIIDSIKDNYEIVKIILNSTSTGAIYIGGGVPKNFVNDAIVMANFDFGAGFEGHKYAIQLSTAMPMDGGLSGSTLSEAVAWGKVSYTARKTNVYLEASIGLPLLFAYLAGNSNISKKKQLNFDFNKMEMKTIK
jgi:deoxyhypusine synthase